MKWGLGWKPPHGARHSRADGLTQNLVLVRTDGTISMLARAADEREEFLTGMCRVCATQEEPLTSIFHESGDQHELRNKIEVCLRIEVRETDILPTTVCEPCVARLDVSYDLLQRFESGQDELQRRIAMLKSLSWRPQDRQVSSQVRLKSRDDQVTSDSDSDSSAPPSASGLTLQTLYPVDPNTSSSSSKPSSPVRFRHTSSNTEAEDCDVCGSLDVLADAVVAAERMTKPKSSSSQGSSSATTSVAGFIRPSASSATVTCTRRRLECEFCAKVFHHTGDLNKHRRCHTGERPYTCDQCDRKFAHVSNLLRHRKVHSGERPFSCQHCERAFSRRDKLLGHNCSARKSAASTSTHRN